MKKEILYTSAPYAIAYHDGIPQEAITFLDSIAWGSEGAVYEHKNTSEHIHQLHNPSLYAIMEADAIRGTAVFCNSTVTVAGKDFQCSYIRYFASSKAIRGKGVMKNLSQKVMELLSETVEDKTILFASIERKNKSSYKVVESAGYAPSGTIKTNGFSRFFPKKSSRIAQIKGEGQQAEVLKLLKEQYAAHALVQFNSLFKQDNYYCIRENGKIVAGCQFHKAVWAVNKMSGLSGKLIMNLVPKIPVLNKVFNPNHFEFLGIEGIYIEEGKEAAFFELIEGILAQEKLSSAMFWMDQNCPVLQRINKAGSLGLIHSFVKDSDIVIMANYQNMTSDEVDLVKKQPLFVAAFDYI